MSPFHKGNTGMWLGTKKPVATWFVRRTPWIPHTHLIYRVFQLTFFDSEHMEMAG